MYSPLADELKAFLIPSLCAREDMYSRILRRLEEGNLTREENPISHCCVQFIPCNPATGEVFMVHHKKSGLWIAAGGHIEKGETLLDTLNREIGEELGVKSFFMSLPQPFMMSVMNIENPDRVCKVHHDIWFLIHTSGKDFEIDFEEFHEARWMNFAEARKTVTHDINIRALEVIEERYVY